MNNNYKLKNIKKTIKTSSEIFYEVEFKNGYTTTLS